MPSLVPLALAVCLDVYLVGRMTVGSRRWSAVAAAVSLALFVACWLALPRRLVGGR